MIGVALVLGVLTRTASGFGSLLMALLWASDGYPGPHVALWRYFGASLQWSVFESCFIAFLIGAPEARWALAPRLRRRLSVRQQAHGPNRWALATLLSCSLSCSVTDRGRP